MKKQLFILLFVMACLELSFAQTTIAFNNSTNPPDYLGWDAGTPFDLNIRHDGNFRTNFATNGFTRLLINNGDSTNTMGRIAMGANLPQGYLLEHRLHLVEEFTEPNFLIISSDV